MTPLEDVFPTAAGREAKGEEAALEEKLYPVSYTHLKHLRSMGEYIKMIAVL